VISEDLLIHEGEKQLEYEVAIFALLVIFVLMPICDFY